LPRPFIIGIAGAKRSGKNTIAEAIAGAIPRVDIIAFADPLRAAAYGLDPIVGEHGLRLSAVVESIGWERAKEEYPEVRRTLQRLGTEGIRALDPDFWVDQFHRAVDASEAEVIVVPDVRFANEVEAVRDHDGLMVGVRRPGLPGGDTHATESGIESLDVDLVIDNDTSVVSLRERAVTFAQTARAIRAVYA
jgi:hypothetical protein